MAANDSFTTPYETALALASAQLLANDTDPDDTPTVTSVQSVVGGTVALNGGNPIFTPFNGYTGTDAGFKYTISDGHGGSSTASVSVGVSAPSVAPVTSEVSTEGHLGARGNWISSNPIQFHIQLPSAANGTLTILANDIENPSADGTAGGEIDQVQINGNILGNLTQGANAADTTTVLSVKCGELVAGSNLIKVFNTGTAGNLFTIVSAVFQSNTTGDVIAVMADSIDRDLGPDQTGHLGVTSAWTASNKDMFVLTLPSSIELRDAALTIKAHDVELPDAGSANGEQDDVYLNNHYLGRLTQTVDNGTPRQYSRSTRLVVSGNQHLQRQPRLRGNLEFLGHFRQADRRPCRQRGRRHFHD